MAGLTTAEKVARGAKIVGLASFLFWILSWWRLWALIFVTEPVGEPLRFVFLYLPLRLAILSYIVYAVAQWRIGKQAGTQMARPETAVQQIAKWSKIVSRSALLVVAISAVPYLLLFEAAQGAGVDAEEGVASAGLVIMALLVLGILSLVVYFITRAKASGQQPTPATPHAGDVRGTE